MALTKKQKIIGGPKKFENHSLYSTQQGQWTVSLVLSILAGVGSRDRQYIFYHSPFFLHLNSVFVLVKIRFQGLPGKTENESCMRGDYFCPSD